jgi:ketosteroid isomerase-like protein
MSQANLDSFRSSIEAFNRRDLGAALVHFHEDIEWHGPPNDPDARTYVGHRGVLDFWQHWFETMDDFQLDIYDCVELGGDRLVAAARVRGKGHGSGVPVEAELFQLVDYRDGKASRVRMFGTMAAAMTAAGYEG